MFGFLFSWFLVLIGLWISWTKTQTLPNSRIPDTSEYEPWKAMWPLWTQLWTQCAKLSMEINLHQSSPSSHKIFQGDKLTLILPLLLRLQFYDPLTCVASPQVITNTNIQNWFLRFISNHNISLIFTGSLESVGYNLHTRFLVRKLRNIFTWFFWSM